MSRRRRRAVGEARNLVLRIVLAVLFAYLMFYVVVPALTQGLASTMVDNLPGAPTASP